MSALFEIDSLSKTYGDGRYALHQVSLSIESGDTFGIIGASGAGKSTLIRSLARLTTPTSGRIFFHGKNIFDAEGAELRAYRKKVGMIFQHFNLLSSRTVEGNIAYALEILDTPAIHIRSRVDELLSLVGLIDKRNAYPSELSGGEKQRVGIARALANSPEVLLCDEATSALDPKTTKEILNLLRELNRSLGLTIILITHQMEVIKMLCNKVAVLERGSIIEQGAVIDIFSTPQHATTLNFVQTASHEIPAIFLKEPSPNRKLLRLRFKGKAAGEPVISEMIRSYQVNANILLGWLDHVHTTIIGTLIVELTGEPSQIDHALSFLREKEIHFEVITS